MPARQPPPRTPARHTQTPEDRPATGAAPGKRGLGAVRTPAAVADFMASLACPPPGIRWDVLEPACADAPFLRAFVRRAGNGHRLTGVEIDGDSLPAFQVPDSRRVHADLIQADFIQADLIRADYLLWQPGGRYDLVIGNPPYGIIGAASHYPLHGLLDAKREYRERYRTWHGKYNVYGAFIEHSVDLLKEGGQLVFVVPATWMLLDDFAPLRRFLAARGSLDVHYLGRAFAGVAVVAVVLHFTKGRNAGRLALYDQARRLQHGTETYRGDLVCFHTPETRRFEAQSDVTVGDVFRVHFAARSPEYKKSPWAGGTREPGMEPVLTGRNLQPGWIDYGTNHSGLWMRPEHAARLRPFYGFPHIVVAHTKGARVVAAYDTRCAAWREEFHLVPLVPTDEGAVVAYLNGAPMQEYVGTLYRDLTPHLTRTQLRRLPLPAL